jgi:etoposide-induced 2.4 mRNA
LLNALWYQEIADRAIDIQAARSALAHVQDMSAQSSKKSHRSGQPGKSHTAYPNSTALPKSIPATSNSTSQNTSGAVRLVVDHIYRLLLCVVYMTLATTIPEVTPIWIGGPIGFAMLCWLYALYSFEYQWSGKGIALHTRLRMVEKRWAYFLGFGFPATAITFAWSTVVASAIFALIFPLVPKVYIASELCLIRQVASFQ